MTAQGTSQVTGAVDVTSLPPVALNDGQTVGIAGVPTVALEEGQTVGIAGVPTVALAEGTTVQVADAPGEPFSWMETVGLEQQCIAITIPEGSTLTIQRITVMGASSAPGPDGMYLRFGSTAPGISRNHFTPLPLGLPAVELDLTLPNSDSNGRSYSNPSICRDGISGYATVSVVGVLQAAA